MLFHNQIARPPGKVNIERRALNLSTSQVGRSFFTLPTNCEQRVEIATTLNKF